MAETTVDLLCKQYDNEKNNKQDNDIASKNNDNDVEPTNDEDHVHESLKDLSNFVVKRILRNNTTQKQIAIEGTFKGFDGSALVVLEKKGFPEDQVLLEQGFFNYETTAKKIYRNDIYRGYDLFPTNEFNGLNATITYPATLKHIEKFTTPEYYTIEETPELYKNVTLPLLSKNFSLKWIDNILDGKAEVDRVIFNDKDEKTGFVLVKDLKWNDDISAMYIIAITRQKIKSIRELNETHLPLLKNIKEAGSKAIEEKYNVPANRLRIYFHYQPSYYHLHVHFTAFTVENAGTLVERAHLLSTVISNIEMMPDYYQKATLTFRVCKYGAYKPYEDYLKNGKTGGKTSSDEDNRPTKRARVSI
ncbi:m7GpppX diphosphatase [Microplitis demolitor]|uniref:m7GpppX diphosphatase n=1 Tax=Microplitis demolitor TaxID=69319 RepID=UPI0004CCEDC8|nr:m7GpppX diphosphatase [Microplitis demolitor]